jgi:hypothetical protein
MAMMTSMRPALGAAVAAVALLAAGCRDTTNCTTEARVSLRVNVVDATGAEVCDATVTARDGDFSQVIGPSDCTYSGVAEREGTYSIEVRSGRRTKTIDDVRVTADECHVHPRSVTVKLDS